MKLIFSSILLLTLFLPKFLWAADDCTFDQANQKSIIFAVAKMKPHGVTDLKNKKIVWNNAKEGITTFSYGGCYDLGSTISNATKQPAPRTQQQVFVLANALAKQFWNNDIVSAKPAALALKNALRLSTFTMEQSGKRRIYNIADPTYVDFYILHEYKNGVDFVELVWQGNF